MCVPFLPVPRGVSLFLLASYHFHSSPSSSVTLSLKTFSGFLLPIAKYKLAVWLSSPPSLTLTYFSTFPYRHLSVSAYLPLPQTTVFCAFRPQAVLQTKMYPSASVKAHPSLKALIISFLSKYHMSQGAACLISLGGNIKSQHELLLNKWVLN